MSLVAYQSSSEESGDEKEEVQESSLSTKVSSKSVAAVQQKSREPVKIAVPSLLEFDAEFEEPSKKPMIKNSSGLLSLLPAPKHSSKLSTFMPNSVKKKITDTKKPLDVFSTPQSSSIAKKRVEETLEGKISSQEFINEQIEQETEIKESDYISPSDFFSLTGGLSGSTSKVSKVNVPPTDFFSLANKSSESTTETSKNDILLKDFFSVTSTSATFNNRDKELSFQDGVSENSNQHHLQNFESPNTSETQNPVNYVSPTYQQESEEDAQYIFSHPSSSSYGVHHSNSPSSAIDESQFTGADSKEECNEQISTDMINDERFLRLQGKRRREFEDIDIIDVNVDSQLADRTQWLTKSITEEKKVSFSRKKGELPTHQQRRKHQITYLAFQAKERELDLKNQWAQNRLTKRETQSKYGF